MRIRNISVRRNHSVSMSDIDFGDDANSARETCIINYRMLL